MQDDKFIYSDAYEPYSPMSAEEQMSMEECIHALEILRCQHFGQRFGMALGIAIRRLQQQQNQEQL